METVLGRTSKNLTCSRTPRQLLSRGAAEISSHRQPSPSPAVRSGSPGPAAGWWQERVQQCQGAVGAPPVPNHSPAHLAQPDLAQGVRRLTVSPCPPEPAGPASSLGSDPAAGSCQHHPTPDFSPTPGPAPQPRCGPHGGRGTPTPPPANRRANVDFFFFPPPCGSLGVSQSSGEEAAASSAEPRHTPLLQRSPKDSRCPLRLRPAARTLRHLPSPPGSGEGRSPWCSPRHGLASRFTDPSSQYSCRRVKFRKGRDCRNRHGRRVPPRAPLVATAAQSTPV